MICESGIGIVTPEDVVIFGPCGTNRRRDRHQKRSHNGYRRRDMGTIVLRGSMHYVRNAVRGHWPL